MRSDRFQATHRKFIWALTGALSLAIAWSCLAQIDIVANAQGKLTPVSLVRVTQPVEGGVVRAIRVKDGQKVAAGDVLVEMDPVYAAEDVKSSDSKVSRLQLQLARVDAELQGTPFLPKQGTEALRAAALNEYSLRKAALVSALSEAQASLDKALADSTTADEQLSRANQLLPLVAKQSGMQQELLKEGFVSDAAATDKLRELVDAKQEIFIRQTSGQSSRAAVAQARSALVRIRTDYQRQLAVERAQAVAELSEASGESAKQGHRLSQTSLVAPVAGIVNGLAALSVGQVVTAGSTLLTVVPSGEALRFEGWLRNEDAAYVAPGMPVKVKATAYPFQKYGWVEGEVAWLGVDSETPDSMRNAQGEPLFYRVRVALNTQALVRNGETYSLKPGMQAMSDVQIGKRTLLEYLTSPMRKVMLEAAREK